MKRSYLAVRQLEEVVSSKNSKTSILHIAGFQVFQVECAHCVGVDERLKCQDSVGLNCGTHSADSLSDNRDNFCKFYLPHFSEFVYLFVNGAAMQASPDLNSVLSSCTTGFEISLSFCMFLVRIASW